MKDKIFIVAESFPTAHINLENVLGTIDILENHNGKMLQDLIKSKAPIYFVPVYCGDDLIAFNLKMQ